MFHCNIVVIAWQSLYHHHRECFLDSFTIRVNTSNSTKRSKGIKSFNRTVHIILSNDGEESTPKKVLESRVPNNK